jgi:hypothetical protein
MKKHLILISLLFTTLFPALFAQTLQVGMRWEYLSFPFIIINPNEPVGKFWLEIAGDTLIQGKEYFHFPNPYPLPQPRAGHAVFSRQPAAFTRRAGKGLRPTRPHGLSRAVFGRGAGHFRGGLAGGGVCGGGLGRGAKVDGEGGGAVREKNFNTSPFAFTIFSI